MMPQFFQRSDDIEFGLPVKDFLFRETVQFVRRNQGFVHQYQRTQLLHKASFVSTKVFDQFESY